MGGVLDMNFSKHEKLLFFVSLAFAVVLSVLLIINTLEIDVPLLNNQDTKITYTKVKPYLININTAMHDELTQLDGIGKKTADKIIEYRRENGSFKSIEELMHVDGIGQVKFDRNKHIIRVE